MPTHPHTHTPIHPYVLGLALLAIQAPARAQLPLIRLDRVFPPGGRAGAAVELAVSGDHFEEVRGLRFDHPGLKAEFVKQEGNTATFRVTAAPGTPPGTHDLRAVGRYGVSNPQLFDVSDSLAEVLEKEPNNLPDQANELPLNSVVSGTTDGGSEDFFTRKGRKGERVFIDCLGGRLGTLQTGVLALLSRDGKQLAYNRRFNGPDPLLDFTVPEDGEYRIRYYDFNYAGGLPYRLRLTTLPYLDAVFPLSALPGSPASLSLFGRGLPGGSAAGLPGDTADLQALPATLPIPGAEPLLQFFMHPPSVFAGMDAFQYRLLSPSGPSNPVTVALAQAPPVPEREPNNTQEQAQELSLPAEVNGRLDAPRDQDWFALTLKAGQAVALEADCERLGQRGDLVLLVLNPKGEDLQEFDDNGQNYNARFNMFNRDPEGRFTAPQDGRYLVLLADRYQRGGPRFVYRLRVSPPMPDYRPVVVHNTETIPSALLVRQGGSQHYHLIALRRDGFEGEIGFQVEGLPPGVVCPPGTLGPGVNLVPLVFTAAPDAPPGEADLRVRTWATLDGKRVEREARYVVQTVPNDAISRMATTLAMAVRPSAPFAVTAAPAQVSASPGATLELKATVQRRWSDFTGAVQLAGLDAPPNWDITGVTIPSGQAEAIVRVKLPQNARPGSYTLVLRGEAQVPFTKDPTGKDKKDVRVTDPSTPVQVVVTAK